MARRCLGFIIAYAASSPRCASMSSMDLPSSSRSRFVRMSDLSPGAGAAAARGAPFISHAGVAQEADAEHCIPRRAPYRLRAR